MKTYTVHYAEDVPHYGSAEIEAENDATGPGDSESIRSPERGQS